jgi:F-type H+-transporting ATPase subunit b
MSLFRNIRVFAATVLFLLLTSLPARAEEAGGGEKAGMPQFDPSLFPEQIFWLVVSFLMLYVLMAFVALPRVSKTQENRKSVITKEIETARAANETAKASVGVTEKSLAIARADAQAKVSEMLASVAEEANERRAVQEKELLRKLHRAEEDIATSRAAALEEIQEKAADLAKAVIEKILEAKRGAA